MSLEEAGLVGSHRRRNLISHLLDVMPGAQKSPVEALDFALNCLGRDLVPRDLTSGLPYSQNAGMSHTIRNRDSVVGARSRTGWLLGHDPKAMAGGWVREPFLSRRVLEFGPGIRALTSDRSTATRVPCTSEFLLTPSVSCWPPLR